MRQLLSVVALTLVIAAPAAAEEGLLDPAAGKTFTIAIVQDGPTPRESIVNLVRDELPALVAETKVRFKTDPAFDGGWSGAAGSERALRNALDDPEVDIILTDGYVVTHIAGSLDLTKPVVSTAVDRAEIFDVADLKGDRPAVPNLSVIMVPLRAETDIAAFAELIPFDVVHIAVEKTLVEHLKGIEDRVRELGRKLGVRVEFLPIGRDVGASLETLDPEVKVVLLETTPRLTRAQREEMIQGLTSRGIPTFSLIGHQDVARGALASRTPDFRLALARRVALNLSEVMRGTPTDELPVILPVDAKLLINARTAVAVGYHPSADVLAFSEFLYPEALKPSETPLSLGEVWELAEANNLAIAIADQDVEIAAQDRGLAKSAFFPQIDLIPNVQSLRLRGLETLIPETTVGAKVQLSQMIYVDRSVSDFKSADRISDGTRQVREQQRIGVLGDSGAAFYDLVGSRVLYRVERDNLALTQQNLELSKVREKVGYSGRDEVYRWEAEVAKRQRQLLVREADIETNRVALNQILGIDQTRRWNPAERKVDPAVWPFVDGRLTDATSTVAGSARALDAFVVVGLENSAALRAIDLGKEAQQIQLDQRKRRWYLPEFGLDFTYDYDFYQSPEIPGVGSDFWSGRIFARYPLTQGRARTYEVRRAASELTRLDREKQLARNLVERATRTAWRRMEASFAAIRYSMAAAEAAEKSLGIVQDKYALGLLNVTDLVQAQNESFAANQAVVIATYGFLRDLIDFQRAISWFEDEKSAAEIDALVQRIETELAQ